MPVAPTAGVVSGGVRTSTTGDWASSSLTFAISRGPCTAAPSTPSQRSALSRHAVVPSRFRVQEGGWPRGHLLPNLCPLKGRSNAELDGAHFHRNGLSTISVVKRVFGPRGWGSWCRGSGTG
jgi:hypothetical protein